ncbi:voltage-gated chloride channel family protein [Gluconobacter sp. DsW_056]|uniref:voltage-gated chloride channel family protein n=1 Tax=Gluconobacter sp. DsW_056 TaxID=1511209 RepID=UPI000A3B34FE|nr:voltage-gated chloride channel family protein [Gluconobacter sp. DsW_056]
MNDVRNQFRFSSVLDYCRMAAVLVMLSVCIGSVCALFLWLLDVVTACRTAHPGLLFGLPLAGVAVGLWYFWFGRDVEGGANLIVDEIHEPGAGVQLRMAPFVLIATVVSHLFGASVGREGTAIQVGGSLASATARLFRLRPSETCALLTCGIAAGFGSVFGTPVAGAVFALEVLTLGRLDYRFLLPAATASIIADWSCRAWGVHHVFYPLMFQGTVMADGTLWHVNPVLAAKVAGAAVVFGLLSWIFAESVHRLAAVMKTVCPRTWLRPAIGGIATILLVMVVGNRDYLGLGVLPAEPGGASIVSFFGPTFYPWSWLWKLVFTVVVLASGFKGGEVTPLFFLGAAAGNVLAHALHVPVDLFAAVGFVSVFAGAANTPLACTLMGVELFGAADIVYFAIGCFVACVCSGKTGIYLSQRVGTMTLREARSRIRN